eukprot:CAMPEP_0185527230 /NCGR_PEP_ID=MMETSP1366-20130426/95483_1 /TAXON_ID=38817 /ORGANISM="Gephyrocapsa oceanica, Strain RCC1303" /LENGTH=33 /DNA_ID= /DNA_START= /DNA_END= /DNA_ORIENTATION=
MAGTTTAQSRVVGASALGLTPQATPPRGDLPYA